MAEHRYTLKLAAVMLCLLVTASNSATAGSVPGKLVSLRLSAPGDLSWVSIASALKLTSDDLEQSYETIYPNGSRTVTLMRAALPTPDSRPTTAERTNTDEASPVVHLTNSQQQNEMDIKEREDEPTLQQWKRKIFGKDDRKKLPARSKAQNAPHAAACKVSCGAFCEWFCTGTLIGSRHVLTSAHCVEKRNVSSLRVGFLQNYGGTHWYNVDRVDFPLSRSTSKKTRVTNDYAVLRLDRASNRTPLSVSSSQQISRGTEISFSAFHGDKGRNSLWLSKCKVALVTANVIAGGNKCDAARGSSGSGIVMSDNKGISQTYVVVGVMAGEKLVNRGLGRPRIFNMAVRMSGKRSTQIQQWISAP